MNRKPSPEKRLSASNLTLTDWLRQLTSRRRFLLAAAGGSLAALFPLNSAGDTPSQTTGTGAPGASTSEPWEIIDAVQQQLFPSEPGIPGAREINALAYLQFVVSDESLDKEDRDFILQGAQWLQQMSFEKHKTAFIRLDNDKREQLLRRIANSEAGENWLSTLLLYIFEALLTDPVYGGNTNEAGWRWLEHTPGFPRPPADKTFVQLLKL